MNILEVMVRVMSPILSFTCDEVWEHYPEAERNREGRPVNVQLAGWPTDADFAPALPEGEEAQAFMDRFDSLLAARDAVTKALEDARTAKTVNKSQEAALPSPRLKPPSKFFRPPMRLTSKSSSSWRALLSSAQRAKISL